MLRIQDKLFLKKNFSLFSSNSIYGFIITATYQKTKGELSALL